MATTFLSAVASQDAAGNILSLVLAGASDDCPGGTLTIQVFDASSSDMLAFGNAPFDGTNWSKTLTVPDDIASGQIACGQTLQVALSCRQGAVITGLGVSPDTAAVQCVSACVIAVGTATGIPSTSAGLDQLTVVGTATGCTSVHVEAVPVGANETVGIDVAVSNGQWIAVFVMGAPGVGTNLKAFRCNRDIDVTVTCNDGSDCSTIARVSIGCGTDCTVDVAMEITRLSNGRRLDTANPTCEVAGSGDYDLRVAGPAGSSIAIIRWTESSSESGGPTVLQDPSGINITANPLTVTIEYPTDAAVNVTYTALVRDGQGCLGVASATFSCGGDLDGDPNAPVDCAVSAFSNWGPCINGQQRRTRTVVTPPSNGGAACPALEQTRACPPLAVDCEVSAWSNWSPCVDGSQRRTRQVVTPPQNDGRRCPALEETRRCGGSGGCDACCIWNWINIGLFAVTAITIIVTLCILNAAVVAAVAAIATGGALAPVFAALTATEIALLWVCVGLLVAGFVSWLVWLIVCLPGNPNACGMLQTLMVALSAIVALSFVLALILAAVTAVGCAAGALIDFAWFGVLLSITTLVYTALGCFDQE